MGEFKGPKVPIIEMRIRPADVELLRWSIDRCTLSDEIKQKLSAIVVDQAAIVDVVRIEDGVKMSGFFLGVDAYNKIIVDYHTKDGMRVEDHISPEVFFARQGLIH